MVLGHGTARPATANASRPSRLAGIEHMLKGKERLKEKIADYLRTLGVTVRGSLDKVPDAVRYTLTYDDAGRYADGVLADVDGLKAEGFELIKLKQHGITRRGTRA
jgi:hypothetical protein